MVGGRTYAMGTIFVNTEASRVDPGDVLWPLVASSSPIGLVGLDPDGVAELAGLKRYDGVNSVPLVEVVCGVPLAGPKVVVEWAGPQAAVPEAVGKAMPHDIER
jgi:hypothetical protein